MFDFKNPDYVGVIERRKERLDKLRKTPGAFEQLKPYYREHLADFITDWGCTYDPRNPEIGRPAHVPFILFDHQRKWVEWFFERWKTGTFGLTEKSRQMGVSWLSVAVGVSMCVLYEGVNGCFGSRKEEYIDKSGDPKSLFHKARLFITALPEEFRAGWKRKTCSAHMILRFPETSSSLTGEAGDNLGRGASLSFYFVDEAAFLPRPQIIEPAISSATNCRIDISTPHGRDNPFAEKRFNGKISVFTFHWRDDPRRSEEWYRQKCEEIGNPTIIAQELDLNYDASVEGVVIPSEWVRSAIDAHIKLGITPQGERVCGFDVADEGADLNAYVMRQGFIVEDAFAWRGKGSDIYASVEKIFGVCQRVDCKLVTYDADGVGAGVKGDSRRINELRQTQIRFMPYHGGSSVLSPESKTVGERINKDFFENLKAQQWWALRLRFLKTYRAVVEGMSFNVDEIISISSSGQHSTRLINELSQPTFSDTKTGKIVIDKKPDGAQSPNLADALVMAFADIRKKGLFYV